MELFCLLSAARPASTPEENSDRHERLREWLTHNAYRTIEAEGCYEGVREKSLMVFSPVGFVAVINYVGWKFAQESVLVVDHQLGAVLTYPGDIGTQSVSHRELIGTWTRVSAGYALEQRAWTRLNTGLYYTTERMK